MILGLHHNTKDGHLYLGGLPYSFYGNRDCSTMGSMEYLCRIIRDSEDEYLTPAGLSEWFEYSPICSVNMTVLEASVFVGLYVSDLIRYHYIISPESVLSEFADIIIALSKMNHDDKVDLCWC